MIVFNHVCGDRFQSRLLTKDSGVWPSFLPVLSMRGKFNSLYTGRPFHCYMLDESICHSMGVGSILSFSFYF